MNPDRLLITPENSPPHAVLAQSYMVEDVAQIAASLHAGTHQERIIEALKLLEAAENIANPNQWESQHLQRSSGDGLGDIPDYEKEQVTFELRQQASEIVTLATNPDGQIDRRRLCRLACDKVGRKSPKSKKTGTPKPLSDDSVERLFFDWLAQAADSYGRWKVFRRFEHDAAKAMQEMRSALDNQSNEDMPSRRRFTKKVAKLRKEWETIESRSIKLEGRYYPRPSEVERVRSQLTKDEIKKEREEFRLMLEKGINTQPRIIPTHELALLMLRGSNEFQGLLEFLRFPQPKEPYVPQPPANRRADGTFAKTSVDDEGRFVSQSKATSGLQEFTEPKF